jgi:HNH endonuclease
LAIGKRLRYEILKRDGFKCRYCHDGEVLITVDHVIPRSLGGSDDPDNLVACCDDCNAGKTSTLPGGANVSGPADDLIRWVRAMKHAAYLARDHNDAMNRYRDGFKEVWDRWRFTADKGPVPLPENWGHFIDQFSTGGLPGWAWSRIVENAMSASVRGDRFKYACDLAWKSLSALQRDARAELAGDADAAWRARDTEAIVNAAVHVWQSHWMPENQRYPSSELIAKFRAQAVELYPERMGAADLMRAAERVASWDTVDLERWLDVEHGDDYWNWDAEDALHWWKDQWTKAAGLPPSQEEADRAALHIRASVVAGYRDVDQAAWCAGGDLTAEIVNYLPSASHTLEGLISDAAWDAEHGETEGDE